MNESPNISELHSHVGYWLRVVTNNVSHRFSKRLEAEGVTVAEWGVLRELLHLGETAPHTLAAHMGMTRGAISKLIDRLVDKHYVDRVPDDKDKRYQRISLTEVGRQLVPYLAEKADANEAHFFGHLTATEKENLTKILQGVIARNNSKTPPIE